MIQVRPKGSNQKPNDFVLPLRQQIVPTGEAKLLFDIGLRNRAVLPARSREFADELDDCWASVGRASRMTTFMATYSR